MAVWVYHADIFRIIDREKKPERDELISIAEDEARKLGITGSVCYLDLGGDAVVEIRPEEGASVKVIKADDPSAALFSFYKHEKECMMLKDLQEKES